MNTNGTGVDSSLPPSTGTDPRIQGNDAGRQGGLNLPDTKTPGNAGPESARPPPPVARARKVESASKFAALPTHRNEEVTMNVDKNLEKEVLTRLLHAHPSGLGKEVLDNYRGEKVVRQYPRQTAGTSD